MSPAVERLLPVLHQLTVSERAEVTEYLRGLDEKDGEPDEVMRKAWEDELNRRHAQWERGEAQGIDSDVFVAAMRKKYGI